MHKEHQIFISSITISELCAKDAKYAASGIIPPERIQKPSRNYNSKNPKFQIHNLSEIL